MTAPSTDRPRGGWRERMLSILPGQDAEQEEPRIAMARMSGENAALRHKNEELLSANAELQETLLSWETTEAELIEELRAEVLSKSQELLELSEKYNDALLKIDILDVEMNRISEEMNETLEKNKALVAEADRMREEVLRVSTSPTSDGSKMRQVLADNDALQAAVEQLKKENSKLIEEIQVGPASMKPSAPPPPFRLHLAFHPSPSP